MVPSAGIDSIPMVGTIIGKDEGEALMIHVEDVIFNGKAVVPREKLKTIVSALSNRDVITEKGGFIFKSRLDDETLNLGILPWFVDGARTYHYNIDIGESKFNLIGFINPNYTVTILFKLDREDLQKGLSKGDQENFLRQYAGLAGLLVKYGFPRDFPLDQISGDVLEIAGICSSRIKTLGELAQLEEPPAKPRASGVADAGAADTPPDPPPPPLDP